MKALALLFMSLCCLGEVYTLKQGVTGKNLLQTLQAEEILRDTIAINGVSGTLTVAHTTMSWDLVETSLATLVDGELVQQNRNSLLIESQRSRQVTRHYLFATGPEKNPLIFSLTAPKAILEGWNFHWPAAFPQPTGCNTKYIMRLSKREVDLAVYTSVAQPQESARSYDVQLAMDGWKRMEGGPVRGGGIYLKERPTRILLFATLGDQTGGTTGAIFMKQGQQLDISHE